MMHETNTFTYLGTGLEMFTCAEGEAVFNIKKWHRSAVIGIADTLQANGAEVIPTFFARTLPSGMVERDAFIHIKSKIVSGVASAGQLDGICLALHGAMSAVSVDDPEGELLSELRRAVGWDIPIVCSLDMHATVTELMVSCSNGFAAYRTAPHTDEYQTGAKAAEMLLASIRTGVQLITRMKKLPILIAGEQTETDKSPTRELFGLLPAEDEKEGVLCSSYVLGFPWADSVHNGAAALVTGFACCADRLAEAAERLANAFYAARMDFTFTTEAHMLDEALTIAMTELTGPVIIADTGDNPTAGASQDTSIAVKALVERGIANALVAVIADKKSYDRCCSTGVGMQAGLALGRLDPYKPEPSPFHIIVRVANTGTIENTGYAVVEHNGIFIVISSARVEVCQPAIMEKLGLRLADFKIILVKSGYLSPEYRKIAARSMLALTPGDACELLDTLPYKVTKRPVFPLDRDA